MGDKPIGWKPIGRHVSVIRSVLDVQCGWNSYEFIINYANLYKDNEYKLIHWVHYTVWNSYLWCDWTCLLAKNNSSSSSSSKIILTRMVQLPATAAIEYVAACCITRTRTITKMKTKTKTKIGTITKIVRGAYARSPQVQCLYAPSGLSVPSVVAWRTNKKKQTNSAS